MSLDFKDSINCSEDVDVLAFFSQRRGIKELTCKVQAPHPIRIGIMIRGFRFRFAFLHRSALSDLPKSTNSPRAKIAGDA